MSNLAYQSDPAGTPERDIAEMDLFRPVPRISVQAFCETEGVARPIERAGEDRRMAKAHLKVHMGGLETAIDFYQTAPTPNLIILESRKEPRELLDSLRQLADVCDPTTKVVIIGHYNDVWLYRELVKSGISEYVVAPVSLADVVGVISSIFVNPDAEPLGIEPLAVIAFDPQFFGNAANNGRMLGEMDAKNAVVATVNEMAHVLTGRSEIKSKKKPGLEGLLGRLKLKKK